MAAPSTPGSAGGTLHVTRADVLAFRWSVHQLGRGPGTAAGRTDVAILDLGVQDTGPDGAGWGLVVRGAPGGPLGRNGPCDLSGPGDGSDGGGSDRREPQEPDGLDPDLALAWTLRGAPHAYRREDLADVAVATAPFSEADAAKRVFTASAPLRKAGIPILDALRTEAQAQRIVVSGPMSKGALSTRLITKLDPPYVRWCNACQATHSYELTFRLAALQAGLELEPGTSPPVLHRIDGLRPQPYALLGTAAEPRFDVVRGYLRFFGPATVQEVAAFVDAPVKDVRAHWPDDVVAVEVDDVVTAGRPVQRWMLADDAERIVGQEPFAGPPTVRLVGPFDPYPQLRDRETLVHDAAHAKDLWRTLGRPGAVLADGEVVGTWRPRTSGRTLTLRVDPWVPFGYALTDAVAEQADRLGDYREMRSTTVDLI